MALYGTAGPAVFQQWLWIKCEWKGSTETREKLRYYTVCLPESRNKATQKMGHCDKEGSEIETGVDEDIFNWLKQNGGVLKLEGELPLPDTS